MTPCACKHEVTMSALEFDCTVEEMRVMIDALAAYHAKQAAQARRPTNEERQMARKHLVNSVKMYRDRTGASLQTAVSIMKAARDEED